MQVLIPKILYLKEEAAKRRRFRYVWSCTGKSWNSTLKVSDTTITSKKATRVKCIKVNYHIIIQLSLLVLSRVNDYLATFSVGLLIHMYSSQHLSPVGPLHCLPLNSCIVADHFITRHRLCITLVAHSGGIK